MDRRLPFLLFFSLCLLTACASQHAPIDTTYVGSGKSATVVVVPPGQLLHKQIEVSGARASDIEFDSFQEGVIKSTANMLGYTAGYYGGLYAAGGPAAGASTAVPVVALAYVAAATTVGVAAKAYRYSKAEDSIEPHMALLANTNTTAFALQTVSGAVSELAHLEVAMVTSADTVEASCGQQQTATFDFEDCIAGLDGDFAVVLAYFPQFSPQFEVLEVQAFVTVFDQSLEAGSDPVYSNFLVYQSKLHAGLHADDTRNEMDELLEQRKRVLLQEASDDGRRSLDAYEKMEVHKRHKRETYALLREYSSNLDYHDPDGEYWLQDDGAHMLSALNEGLTEVVRMAVYDINGGIHDEPDDEVTLPGTERQMTHIESISLPERNVYRDPNGSLVSIDSSSRFVVLHREQ